MSDHSTEIDLVVVDDQGEHFIKARCGQTLLTALQDENIPIGAVCGGSMICGTCHVFLVQDRAKVSAERSLQETLTLEDLRCFDGERSRLACQIIVSEALFGCHVEIAPDD
jgi:2Fe-2S ferredoxin